MNTREAGNLLLDEFLELALFSTVTVRVIVTALHITFLLKFRIEAFHWFCPFHVHLKWDSEKGTRVI